MLKKKSTTKTASSSSTTRRGSKRTSTKKANSKPIKDGSAQFLKALKPLLDSLGKNKEVFHINPRLGKNEID